MTEPRPELSPSAWAERARWTEHAESARGGEVTNEVAHYLRWRDSAAQKLASETGISEGRAVREVNAPDSEFHERYWRARRADFPHDKSGVFADFLVFIGQRSAGDWWDVGDTPQE